MSMIEIDLGIKNGPCLSFALLTRCVDKGIITRDGGIKLWTEEITRG